MHHQKHIPIDLVCCKHGKGWRPKGCRDCWEDNIGDIKGKERKKEKNRNDNGDDEKEEKAFNMIEEDGNNWCVNGNGATCLSLNGQYI